MTLKARYQRIGEQFEGIMKTGEISARMATMTALLHFKMRNNSWTGFYLVREDSLVVSVYQGPVACTVLPAEDGVCWACVKQNEPVVVNDVKRFPGHISCDDRTRSEVVVPVCDSDGLVRAVLDVDSRKPAAFTGADAEGLLLCASMIYGGKET